ncbi:MAG: ABC transporter [Rhodobacteraceae bacterium PARR1]|nr:MAG: ABC transporter [Rhodobacteraceae bacterium PARR1]
MTIPLRLALRELRHDWIAALCFVAALVGVLGPMLIILALKNGVIGGMVDRLVEDPANREIIAVGTGAYDPAFFDWLGQRPDVDFVSPATRSINALADGLRSADGKKTELSVPLIVSAPGDPLLGAVPVAAGKVWITAALAEKLGVTDGGGVTMFIGREISGRQESARVELTVVGVVPSERYRRAALFLSLPDMLAVERFRDSAAITPDTWLDDITSPSQFASFRLYARDLADLEGVMQALSGRGVETRPRAENAVLLLKFRSNLDLIYGLLAVLALAGFWAAMAANLRGMVERRRLAFSLLRLIGLSGRARMVIPLLQSLMLIGCGIGLSFAVVLPVLGVLNVVVPGAESDVIATLRWRDVLGAVGIGALTAVTAAGWAMRAVAAIQSEEVLRNG